MRRSAPAVTGAAGACDFYDENEGAIIVARSPVASHAISTQVLRVDIQ